MGDEGSRSLRLFFACELPGEIKENLTSLREKLRRSSPHWRASNWKWVETGNLHLTLRFLGETPGERLDEVVDAGREAVKGVSAFSLAVGGLGFFPSRGPVRVVWAGVGDSGELLRLRERLEEALASRGLVREEREFHPHLTLARARQPVPRELLRPSSPREGEPLAETEVVPLARPIGTFQVRELVLFRSILRPPGPEYHPLATFTLNGG